MEALFLSGAIVIALGAGALLSSGRAVAAVMTLAADGLILVLLASTILPSYGATASWATIWSAIIFGAMLLVVAFKASDVDEYRPMAPATLRKH